MCYNAISDIPAPPGLEVKHLARKVMLPLDRDDIVKLYLSGESVKSISHRCGMKSYDRIIKELLEAGVRTRTISENKLLEWERMTEEQRRLQVAGAHASGAAISVGNKRRFQRMTQEEINALVKPAHDATRGSKKSDASLLRAAQRRQERGQQTELEEFVCYAMTQWHELTGTHQQAIGKYNCDAAFGSVAVEIWGGHHHLFGKHVLLDPIRMRHFLNNGWHVYVMIIRGQHQLSPEGAHNLNAFVQLTSSEPTMLRQYRVVWGTGEVLASGSVNDDDLTIVESLNHCRNMRTSNYKG